MIFRRQRFARRASSPVATMATGNFDEQGDRCPADDPVPGRVDQPHRDAGQRTELQPITMAPTTSHGRVRVTTPIAARTVAGESLMKATNVPAERRLLAGRARPTPGRRSVGAVPPASALRLGAPSALEHERAVVGAPRRPVGGRLHRSVDSPAAPRRQTPTCPVQARGRCGWHVGQVARSLVARWARRAGGRRRLPDWTRVRRACLRRPVRRARG